jgi:hypothetical protein
LTGGRLAPAASFIFHTGKGLFCGSAQWREERASGALFARLFALAGFADAGPETIFPVRFVCSK